MFRSIVVPIDIAHASSWRFAIPEALELAMPSGARVAVITVVRELSAMFEGIHLPLQLERMVADAENELAEIVSAFDRAGLDIEREVRYGSIGREILHAAQARDADLIVMASHRPEMLDYAIGPNAAHVAQHATCSVLILRKFATDV